jgi:hypothetical protein
MIMMAMHYRDDCINWPKKEWLKLSYVHFTRSERKINLNYRQGCQTFHECSKIEKM